MATRTHTLKGENSSETGGDATEQEGADADFGLAAEQLESIVDEYCWKTHRTRSMAPSSDFQLSSESDSDYGLSTRQLELVTEKCAGYQIRYRAWSRGVCLSDQMEHMAHWHLDQGPSKEQLAAIKKAYAQKLGLGVTRSMSEPQGMLLDLLKRRRLNRAGTFPQSAEEEGKHSPMSDSSARRVSFESGGSVSSTSDPSRKATQRSVRDSDFGLGHDQLASIVDFYCWRSHPVRHVAASDHADSSGDDSDYGLSERQIAEITAAYASVAELRSRRASVVSSGGRSSMSKAPGHALPEPVPEETLREIKRFVAKEIKAEQRCRAQSDTTGASKKEGRRLRAATNPGEGGGTPSALNRLGRALLSTITVGRRSSSDLDSQRDQRSSVDDSMSPSSTRRSVEHHEMEEGSHGSGAAARDSDFGLGHDQLEMLVATYCWNRRREKSMAAASDDAAELSSASDSDYGLSQRQLDEIARACKPAEILQRRRRSTVVSVADSDVQPCWDLSLGPSKEQLRNIKRAYALRLSRATSRASLASSASGAGALPEGILSSGSGSISSRGSQLSGGGLRATILDPPSGAEETAGTSCTESDYGLSSRQLRQANLQACGRAASASTAKSSAANESSSGAESGSRRYGKHAGHAAFGPLQEVADGDGGAGGGGRNTTDQVKSAAVSSSKKMRASDSEEGSRYSSATANDNSGAESPFGTASVPLPGPRGSSDSQAKLPVRADSQADSKDLNGTSPCLEVAAEAQRVKKLLARAKDGNVRFVPEPISPQSQASVPREEECVGASAMEAAVADGVAIMQQGSPKVTFSEAAAPSFMGSEPVSWSRQARLSKAVTVGDLRCAEHLRTKPRSPTDPSSSSSAVVPPILGLSRQQAVVDGGLSSATELGSGTPSDKSSVVQFFTLSQYDDDCDIDDEALEAPEDTELRLLTDHLERWLQEVDIAPTSDDESSGDDSDFGLSERQLQRLMACKSSANSPVRNAASAACSEVSEVESTLSKKQIRWLKRVFKQNGKMRLRLKRRHKVAVKNPIVTTGTAKDVSFMTSSDDSSSRRNYVQSASEQWPPTSPSHSFNRLMSSTLQHLQPKSWPPEAGDRVRPNRSETLDSLKLKSWPPLKETEERGEDQPIPTIPIRQLGQRARANRYVERTMASSSDFSSSTESSVPDVRMQRPRTSGSISASSSADAPPQSHLGSLRTVPSLDSKAWLGECRETEGQISEAGESTACGTTPRGAAGSQGQTPNLTPRGAQGTPCAAETPRPGAQTGDSSMSSAFFTMVSSMSENWNSLLRGSPSTSSGARAAAAEEARRASLMVAPGTPHATSSPRIRSARARSGTTSSASISENWSSLRMFGGDSRPSAAHAAQVEGAKMCSVPTISPRRAQRSRAHTTSSSPRGVSSTATVDAAASTVLTPRRETTPRGLGGEVSRSKTAQPSKAELRAEQMRRAMAARRRRLGLPSTPNISSSGSGKDKPSPMCGRSAGATSEELLEEVVNVDDEAAETTPDEAGFLDDSEVDGVSTPALSTPRAVCPKGVEAASEETTPPTLLDMLTAEAGLWLPPELVQELERECLEACWADGEEYSEDDADADGEGTPRRRRRRVQIPRFPAVAPRAADVPLLEVIRKDPARFLVPDRDREQLQAFIQKVNVDVRSTFNRDMDKLQDNLKGYGIDLARLWA
eukprot:TRINITY_DN41832_c0_g1_i1.p1 TRINITY_DN41832_c0_g1~~TRINITY_DN41832_c0_g1_i1.p1  ORF type:complete len:1676 (+),score=345.41 TRINITY_DN41832_c0_g1_i1:95-5122(+)